MHLMSSGKASHEEIPSAVFTGLFEQPLKGEVG